MPLQVLKFGGSSLDSTAKIQHAAERISKIHSQGNQVIAVVSAMGGDTDRLVQLAFDISPTPNGRELDMLISTGERVSASLLSMALIDKGLPAISFTGSQAGIMTNASHTNAEILDVKPIRLEKELGEGKIVVMAGFQGVDPVTKDITTLGRGGTDLTAVTMAHYFKADQCRILKDVDGIYTADPRIVPAARKLDSVSGSALREMTFWGAQFLHSKAADFAVSKEVPLTIESAEVEQKGTHINYKSENREDDTIKKPLAITHYKNITKIDFEVSQNPPHGFKFQRQIRLARQNDNRISSLYGLSSEDLICLKNMNLGASMVATDLSAATITWSSQLSEKQRFQIKDKVSTTSTSTSNDIVQEIVDSEQSVSWILSKDSCLQFARELHSAFF